MRDQKSELFGDGQRAALFYLAEDAQQVRAGDVVDGEVIERREDLLLEDAPDLRQAGLSSFFQRKLTVGQPQFIDGLEAVFACQNGGLLLILVRLFAFGSWVD
jgi:hypothetical protein